MIDTCNVTHGYHSAIFIRTFRKQLSAYGRKPWVKQYLGFKPRQGRHGSLAGAKRRVALSGLMSDTGRRPQGLHP